MSIPFPISFSDAFPFYIPSLRFCGCFRSFPLFRLRRFYKNLSCHSSVPALQSKKGYSVPMIFTNKKEAVLPHLCRALDSEWNCSAGGNRPEPPNCPVTWQTAKAVVFPFSRPLGHGLSHPRMEPSSRPGKDGRRRLVFVPFPAMISMQSSRIPSAKKTAKEHASHGKI